MSSRHLAREIALQILYRYDLDITTSKIPLPEAQELASDVNKHFEHFKVDEDSRGFAAELVVGTLLSVQELDEMIEKHASNWKLNRMAVVDRCLLRMSSLELKRFPETPASVVIDEAIELAKEFGTQESPSFINGVLDAISKTLR